MDNQENNQSNNQKNDSMDFQTNQTNDQIDKQYAKNKSNKVIIAVLLIITILMISNAVDKVGEGKIFGDAMKIGSKGNYSYNMDQHKIFEYSNENIILQSVSTDVKVIVDDRKDIKVDFFGEIKSNSQTQPELIIEKAGNDIKIYIDYHKNNSIREDDAQLEVYIPKDFSKTFKIQTVSAQVEAAGLKADTLCVDVTSGEVELSEIEAKNALEFQSVSAGISLTDIISNKTTIESVSGDITIEGSLGQMNINTVSGDIDAVTDQLIASNKIETISGEFQLDIPDNTPFGFDLNSVSGDIDISEDIDVQLSAEKEHMKKGKSGSNTNVYLEAQTVSGDITIE